MVNKSLLSTALALMLALPLCAQELMLSAASSLTDVLTALRPDAERFIGAKLILNFGSSGSLRAQIEQGAPADAYFSASSADMDRLALSGLVIAETRRDLLANALALIGDKRISPITTASELRLLLSSAGMLAIGNPDSVPAGKYAVEALRALGLYPVVDKKLAFGGSARQVLQFVESGSAPLGIVFVTDIASMRSSSIKSLYVFPASTQTTRIDYPAAVLASSKMKEKAARLILFFQGETARRAFKAAGFILR